MGTDRLSAQTELFFRTYVQTVLPLHAALVDELCRAPKVPLELATVLEDIGQAYMRLAEKLSVELIRRDEFDREPDPEDAVQTRIDAVVESVLSGVGQIVFDDGGVIDGGRALGSFPAAAAAIRTALLVEKARRDAAAPKVVPKSVRGDALREEAHVARGSTVSTS